VRFEAEVFISYAYIDNQPITAGQQGWVSQFHASLAAMLSMRLGREVNIWRHEMVRGDDVVSDEIVRVLNQTAVLVSVVTSGYLNSEWCMREAREFCESAQQRGRLVVHNKSPVFKVFKTPVDEQESLPAAIRNLLGYEFFTVKEDGRPIELDPSYGDEYAHLFGLKIVKLAWDISQSLKP
jgi:hypothetical protein